MTTTFPTQTVHPLLYQACPGEVTDLERWEDDAACDPADTLTCTVCGGPASPAYLADDGPRCLRCEPAERCTRCGVTVGAGAFFGTRGATCWTCTDAAVRAIA